MRLVTWPKGESISISDIVRNRQNIRWYQAAGQEDIETPNIVVVNYGAKGYHHAPYLVRTALIDMTLITRKCTCRNSNYFQKIIVLGNVNTEL